jgi:hypothetical protein
LLKHGVSRPEKQNRVGRSDARHVERHDVVDRLARVVVLRRPVHAGDAAERLEPPRRIGKHNPITLARKGEDL